MKKKLPAPLRVIGTAAAALVYAAMLALVLLFFTGHGQFIYEAL